MDAKSPPVRILPFSAFPLLACLAADAASPSSARAEEPPFASIIRGPYLQNLTPSNIVVRWRTDMPVASGVRFHARPNSETWTISDPSPKTEHSITLTNLAADTGYQYQVESETDVLSGGDDHFFHTGPALKRPTRIWVIGDSGTASVAAKAVYDRYR